MLLLGPKPAGAPRLDRPTLLFLCALFGISIISLLVMRWAGTAVSAMLGAEEYRLLRDNVPWKYIGFGLGGFLLVSATVCLVERRVTWHAAATGAFAVVLIILLYDLPFEDLLLPPNGDV